MGWYSNASHFFDFLGQDIHSERAGCIKASVAIASEVGLDKEITNVINVGSFIENRQKVSVPSGNLCTWKNV